MCDSGRYVGDWDEGFLEHALKSLQEANRDNRDLPSGTTIPVRRPGMGRVIGQLRKTGSDWRFDKAD